MNEIFRDNLGIGMHPDAALFQAFAVARKKQRYVELLGTERGREKIRRGPDHFPDLDPRFCRKIKPNEQNVSDVARILRGLGASAVCNVISSDTALDGREMELVEALKAIIGKGSGALVSCVPGKLAYYESETPGERYVCHREG